MSEIILMDNGEPLVDVRQHCPGIVVKIGKKRNKREKTAYLRLTVANMLSEAQKLLPFGYNFIINDAWRSASEQKAIHDRFVVEFRKIYPNKSLGEIKKEVGIYVAPWQGIKASGHMTGGAVDLRIIDRHGHKIPMRSRHLNYQENAKSNQPKLLAYLQRNREILFSVMREVGFSNHQGEFWHWSYGDWHWAKRERKSVALYGITVYKTLRHR